MAGSQLEQSLICHFLLYLPFISETRIEIVMGLNPWEARRLSFLCFALCPLLSWKLGVLSRLTVSFEGARVQKYKWRSTQ